MEEDPDSFVIYGNALPPLEEENASAKKMKPTPIEEQIATDENGRRRFHGAFTGGFSAGFFNTAGSRDGWTPRHFKSSRSNRIGQPGEQRPEDFMDDEDMGEFGIAHRKLQTSKEFSSSRKRKEVSTVDAPIIPGDPVLEQYIRPAQETIGVRLLKEMGWKPGQGIGPKLLRNRKKAVSRKTKALFTREAKSAHNEEDEDDEDDDKYKDFLFAPDDIPDFVAQPKENLFGIAYSGLERGSSVLSSSSHINLFGLPMTKFDNAAKKKLKISGQAFGVGAYEEEDDDIYQRDDMSRYDFALLDDDDQNNKKRPKKASRWDKDLVACLEGFTLAKKSLTLLQKNFEPPEIPKGFQPKGLARKSRFEPSSKELSTTNPTPDQRRSAINDHQEEEFMTEEQVKAILSGSPAEDSSQFKPFASDAGKQKRYEQFMACLKHGNALPILQPKDMPEWERERERLEFHRASMLFRPLNFSMSSRFVSAGMDDNDKAGQLDQELSEAEKAAKMKLYGHLTRETLEWHPARLLCVRFNVKPPFGDASVVGVAVEAKSKFDLFGRLNVVEAKQPVKELSVTTEEKEPINADLEACKEEEVEEEKPPMDLFKSIFLASEDSEEEEEEEEETSEQNSKVAHNSSWMEKPHENLLRNPAPAKGIFANIDFDKLNKKTPSSSTLKQSVSSEANKPFLTGMPSSKTRMSATDFFTEPDFFGPKKPEEGVDSMKGSQHNSKSNEEDDEWVEKSSKKKKLKKKKKDKKEHRHRSKSKKKKKKKSKKRHSNPSSTSSSSD